MRLNFYLKDPSSKTETNILLFFSYKSKRLKYYSGISILPKQWSKSKQIIYSGVTNSEELNEQLRELKNNVEKEYLNQLNKGVIPTPAYLKDFLNNRLKDEEIEVENFHSIFEKFKLEKNRVNNDASMRRFGALMKHFLVMESYYKMKFSVHSFTKDFYHKFIDYFIFECEQVNSTVKEKHLKAVNTFLNWLVDNNYIEKNNFKGIKFPYKVSPADTISLSEEELNKLFNLDLSYNKRLEQVRDVFCIECYTGLRYSDTKKIQNHKINGRILEIHTQKTTDKLKVPLRKEALEILNKYFKKKLPLPVISNQKMNKYLKELGQKAELNDHYTILRVVGKKKEETIKTKHELLATHTGRRTFVTLSYRRGMKPLDIMKITGHKDYNSFIRYYRLDEIEVTDTFFSAWEEVKPKYKTSEIIRNLLKKGVSKEIIAKSFGIDIDTV